MSSVRERIVEVATDVVESGVTPQTIQNATTGVVDKIKNGEFNSLFLSIGVGALFGGAVGFTLGKKKEK